MIAIGAKQSSSFGRLWRIADADGQTLIEPKYRAISCFEGGLAWVPLDDRKAWCPIDRKGKVRESVGCVTNYMATRIFDAGPEKMSDDPMKVVFCGCGPISIMGSASGRTRLGSSAFSALGFDWQVEDNA
jgi:hypothetical protein